MQLFAERKTIKLPRCTFLLIAQFNYFLFTYYLSFLYTHRTGSKQCTILRQVNRIDTKKRIIPEVRVRFIYVRRVSSIQIQHFSGRETIPAIILLTSINVTVGRQIFTGEAITEIQKIRTGTASLRRFEKGSLYRRSYNNYFQKCLLEAKSCPRHFLSAAAGAIV